MIPVGGKPFLEHQLSLLERNGIDDFVICVGYLGEQVEAHFGDGGEWGVRIRYSRDGEALLGPAGALKGAERLLGGRFFVTYGDAYLRLDYGAMMASLTRAGKLGMMAVYENRGRYGMSDVAVEEGYVVRYDKKAAPGEMAWVNFGVSALSKRSLGLIPSGAACGEEEFYGKLITRRELLAFEARERFYEIGTPASLEEFGRFVAGKE
jgi:NDP-sugar pyrophosphorylase family protein